MDGEHLAGNTPLESFLDHLRKNATDTEVLILNSGQNPDAIQ